MKFTFTEYQDLTVGGFKDCNLTFESDMQAYHDSSNFYHSSVGERYQIDVEDENGDTYIIAWFPKNDDEWENPDHIDWDNPDMLLKRS